MCNDRALFNNSDFNTRLGFPPVLGANLDNPLQVEGMGSILLALSGGEVLLRNVLFVPNIGKNLICVSSLLSDGYSLVFNSSQSGLPGCVLRLKDRVICLPVQKNNLWAVFPEALLSSAPSAHVAATMADWHLRLGHIPPSVIAEMVEQSSITGMKLLPGGRNVATSCVGCPLGKQARAPLTTTVNKVPTQLLGRIHTDLSGPWGVATCGRQCYYLLSLVDDCSRYAWIYLLRKKSEVFELFQKWKTLVENQTEHTVKILRSDNGGEFCSGAMEDFLEKHGIIHEHTNPYTPQENGTAERFNRTIQEKIQCLLQTSDFPPSMWGEAAYTACHLYNLTPHSVLSPGITPFEVWYRYKPSAEPLHVFGCDVTVHIPGHKRKKPGAHAKVGKFVGYAVKQPGWRVWYPAEKTIVEARDVKFFDTPIVERAMNVLYPTPPTPSPTSAVLPTPVPLHTLSESHASPVDDDEDDENDSPPLLSASEGGNSVLLTTDEERKAILREGLTESPIPFTPMNVSTDVNHNSSPTPFPPAPTSLSPILENASECDDSAAILPDPPSEHEVPDLDELLAHHRDFPAELGEPEDLLESLQGEMLPYSDRPLPRRSHRVTRKPLKLLYSRPGSPTIVREANMTVSGRHLIPEGTMLQSIYPTSPLALTDSSLLHSCFHSELTYENALHSEDSIDACIPLTPYPIPPDEIAMCFASEVHAGEPTDHLPDPETLEEALAGPDGEQWEAAYRSEMESIDHHETYAWEPLPPGKNLVTGRFVFKKKPARDGKPVRYKVRGVARGFSQKYGSDYNEIFAPVVKYKTLRLACGIAAKYDMHMHKMDVKTAFLNSNLEEEIFMQPLPGCIPPVGKEGCVWRLHRSLYGLKQSPRCWNTLLHEYLISEGFTRLVSDYGTYRRGRGKGLTLITVYVDDLLILNRNISVVNGIKANLAKRFDMVDFGEAKSILGISISRDREKGTLSLYQTEYIDNLLATFAQKDSPTRVTPLEPGVKLRKCSLEDSTEDYPYRALVGSLMHIMVCTRPDIAAAVGVLSRFLDRPSLEHWEAALRVLHYLKGTRRECLTFHRNSDDDIFGYCDSDWAGDLDDNRSTSGWVFIWCGAAVSWQSKKQKSCAQSSCEAEYYAAGMAAFEVSWYWNILTELHMKPSTPITVYTDSQSAMNLSANPVFHERSKHIANKWHFIRDLLHEGLLSLEKVHTDRNLADALTKAVPGPKVAFTRLGMGLSPVALFTYWMTGVTLDGFIEVPHAA